MANSSRNPPSIDGAKHGKADPPPVGPRRTAEVRRCLAPGRFQPVDRRQRDEHHQRDLEVHVDRDPSPEPGDVEPSGVVQLDTDSLVDQLGAEPLATEQREEQERQDDATHVGGDTAERRHQRTQPLGPLGSGGGVGDGGSDDHAQRSGDQRDLGGTAERFALGTEHVDERRRREAAASLAPEPLLHHAVGRKQQEQEQEREERNQAGYGRNPHPTARDGNRAISTVPVLRECGIGQRDPIRRRPPSDPSWLRAPRSRRRSGPG